MLWKNSMGPEKSPQEVLAGLVERVTYHNVENGFCVLRASNVGGGAK
jgi:exodeoxyribonuclease V alpha subunit